MPICQLDISALKAEAARRLRGRPDAQRVFWVHQAAALGLPLLVSLLSLFLSGKTDDLSGLSNLQRRSMLISLQLVLQLAVNLAMPFWDGGYANAMLNVSRQQRPGRDWYLWGFRQWKAMLISGLLLVLQAFALMYFAAMVAALVVLMSPLAGSMDAAAMEAAMTAGDMDGLMAAMLPVVIACVLAGVAVMLFLFYRYRFFYYVIRDGRGKVPASRMLAMSAAVSKKCRLQLLKLDLSYWWYYGLHLLAYGVAYLDVLLALLGKSLPGSGDAVQAVLMVAYTLCSLGVAYLGKNRVSVSFALAYGKIRQEKGMP